MNKRNERVVDKGEMNIEMDPDVAAAFHASTAVSCKYKLALSLYEFLNYPCSVERLGCQHAEDWCEEEKNQGPD